MSSLESVPESPNILDDGAGEEENTKQQASSTNEESALAMLSRDEMIDDDLYEQLLEDEELEKSDAKELQESVEEDIYDDECNQDETRNNYDYQEGFSSEVQNKTIVDILQSFFDTDYPLPPLNFQDENGDQFLIPFPTLEQLKLTFRNLNCLYLFTFLSRYSVAREDFKKEFLYNLQSLPVKHKGFRSDHVDIIFHDIAQQILLRAPRSLLEIKNDAITNPKFLSLGDEVLDSIFETPISKKDGIYGIPFKETSGGFIVELSGMAGSGKTQLALQLCLQSILPEEFGGLNSKSMYLFSEQNPVERLNEMAQAKVRQCNEYYKQHNIDKTIETSYLLDNVIQRKVVTKEDLDEVLVKKNHHSMTLLENEIEKRGIKLVVLDSMGMLYRDSSANSTIERAEALQNQVQSMKYLATKYRILFIVLNQVTSFFHEENETIKNYHQSHRNESLNNEEAHSSYIYNIPKEIYKDEEEENDEDDFMIGDISKVRSYFRVTPSDITKPALGLYWSTLVDIRLFITKLSRRDIVIGSKKNIGIPEKKQKTNTQNIIYLRDYETTDPTFENSDTSRQLHVIYSPFSPTTSRSFIIDSFGVKGL